MIKRLSPTAIGRWSTRRPVLAIAVWLSFVVAAVLALSLTGSKPLDNGAVGESAHGYALMNSHQLGLPQSEYAYLHSTSLNTGDEALRGDRPGGGTDGRRARRPSPHERLAGRACRTHNRHADEAAGHGQAPGRGSSGGRGPPRRERDRRRSDVGLGTTSMSSSSGPRKEHRRLRPMTFNPRSTAMVIRNRRSARATMPALDDL